jgi:acyl-CoA thioesterase
METFDLRQFQDFFTGDRFAVNAGIVIESVAENSVRCSMRVTKEHLNAGGVVQGGAIFTLADFAFAVHSNRDYVRGAEGGITVAQSCAISFLKPARGERLEAATACLSKGKTMSVYRVTVTDDQGAPVAEFTGNAFTTRGKR